MSKYSETHAIIQNCYETLRSITKTEPTTVQVFRGLEEKYSYSTIYHHLRYIKVKFEQTQKISNIVDTRLIKTTYQQLLAKGLFPTHYQITHKLHPIYSIKAIGKMVQVLKLDNANLYYSRIESAYYGFMIQGLEPTTRQVRDTVDPTLALSTVARFLREIAGKPRRNKNNKATYAEVYQVFMLMHAENKHQSVNAIRVRLGKGSQNDVGKHLQTLKEKYPRKIVGNSQISRLQQDIYLAYEKLSTADFRPSAKEIQAVLSSQVSLCTINKHLVNLRGNVKKGRYTQLTLELVLKAHVDLLSNGLPVTTHRLFEHLQLGSPATVYSHIRHIKREIMAVFEKELAAGLTPTDVSIQAALSGVFPPVVIEHYLHQMFDHIEQDGNEKDGQD